METYSSVLAWRIPGTEEPGGLPSMGSHRVTCLSSRKEMKDHKICVTRNLFRSVPALM